jgi:hypothetical protein
MLVRRRNETLTAGWSKENIDACGRVGQGMQCEFLLLRHTRVLFFRQEFFDREIKIKFRFLLVGVGRDF